MKVHDMRVSAIVFMVFLFPGMEAGAQTGGTLRPLDSVKTFTDEDIEKRTQKLIEFLFSQQLPDGNWPPGPSDPDHCPAGYPAGPSALAVYALIEAGISAKDPRLAKAFDWLVKNQDGDMTTYSVGMRCNAWLAANRQTSDKYQKNLEKDVEYLVLVGTTNGGGYRYFCSDRQSLKGKKDPGAIGDNSNSQYILLGVWAGARAGMEIPKEFWETCLKFWLVRQHANGGWNYGLGNDQTVPPYGSMSTAGLASLFVCIDAAMGDKFIKCNVSNEFTPVKKGLDWFVDNFEKTLTAPWTGNDRNYFDYYMYGLERVGLASGFKYFGKYDWYKEGCKRFLAMREPQDSRGNVSVHSVAFNLLFFSRGRRPVLLNKLEYDGDWNNRPRALANFCRWSEKVFETENNWQIITLKSEVGEWHDAPVVMLTGSKAPKFSDEEIVKLRTYVHQGGTLFSITECSGAPFTKGIKELYQKLFPKYELTLCGKEHPLNNMLYKSISAVRLSEVRNGIRPLAIHADTDLPLAWQQYQVATGRVNFEAAANMLMYVTDKLLKNRGANLWPEEPAKAPSKTLKAARIRYAGNYDPEPLAMQRASRMMATLHDLKVNFIPAVSALAQAPQPAAAGQPTGPRTGIAPSELTDDIKLAIMAGTGGFKLETADKDVLKKWMSAGGILLLDATGSKAFIESAKNLVAELFGDDALLTLPFSSPLYQLEDMTIDKVKYRRITKARIGPGNKEPRLLAVLKGDRPMVIVSQEDITGGLVGYTSATCDGYEPESAFNVMRNIIIYTATSLPAVGDATSKPSSAPAIRLPTAGSTPRD
ncbi:MAG: DUF4159 domain-containing protein [Planctomycetes bacterium]|nr:DUF4159 domain-containing protein [Planctomycetota bacterium]